MSYKKPTILGLFDQVDSNAMAANRYQGYTNCCSCTGHGTSRG